MSSTERAPEPTMEEILASIRRIISDDEASSVQQRATSSEYAEQVRADDTEDGAADTQMIDHLARALGGGAKPAANDVEPDQSSPEEPAIVVEMPAPEPAVSAQAAPTLDDPTTALERAI